MRSFALTLIPMFILAVFTAVVGERLSKHTIEERIPVDRDRLLDLSSTLKSEIQRLDSLYLQHLNTLANGYKNGDDKEVEEYAEKVTGIKSVAIFSKISKWKEFEIPDRSFASSISEEPISEISIPEVTIEGHRSPFHENRAVIIPKQQFNDSTVGQSGWILSPEKRHLVYWSRPSQGDLVAIVIDKEEWLTVTSKHLETWLPTRVEPLLSDATQFVIDSPSGNPLYSTYADHDQSPAGIVIPIRTYAGEWLVQAWDELTLKSYRDPLTLSLATLLAGVFPISGFLLYQQQTRSLKLAKKRVSFVNQVSHELGSPLTNITLNLDLVSESLSDSSPSTKRRLSIVTEEIGRLNRMIANVLTFSQSTKNKLELHIQPCFPDEIIVATLDSFRPTLTRHSINIEQDLGIRSKVKTDSDALSQIMGNLISNVEKYASKGKWIKVQSRLINEHMIISVADRGHGVPYSAKERIFRSFERVHSSVDEGSSGTGLGLSIARELAHKLGGKLVLLESKTGCHFELSIPYTPIAALVESQEKAS